MEPSGKRHWRVKEEDQTTRKNTLAKEDLGVSRMISRGFSPVSKMLRPEVYHNLAQIQSLG
eukprot:1145613-Pelagomonas_calceolata.AAC.3